MKAESSLPASLGRVASASQKRYFGAAIEAASRLAAPLYLVGGVVRDLLLTGRIPGPDLDFVLEGDARSLATDVAHRLEARLTVHERFLTAEVEVGGSRLDFVTARGESYERPAALPEVWAADLAADLARRDFSVNAMALPLWPEASAGEIVDPFEGRRDLANRHLRVLHERSFFDDPTRILRGVRLAARLELDFDQSTEDLAHAAISGDAFGPLSGSRLRHELILLMQEPRAERSWRHLEALGFLRVLGRKSKIDENEWRSLAEVQSLRHRWDSRRSGDGNPRWWLVDLLSLFRGESEDTRARLVERLNLDSRLAEILQRTPEELERLEARLDDVDVPPHEVCERLEGLATEQLALLMAGATGRARTWVDLWDQELRHLELGIDGTDLVKAGHLAGPPLGRALRATLAARRDGLIEAEEELAHALRLLDREEI